jgi:hypothetical protein
MIKYFTDLKAGDIVSPFVNEFTGKKDPKRIEILEGPFECEGAFKDFYVRYKIKDETDPTNNELMMHVDTEVIIVV